MRAVGVTGGATPVLRRQSRRGLLELANWPAMRKTPPRAEADPLLHFSLERRLVCEREDRMLIGRIEGVNGSRPDIIQNEFSLRRILLFR